MKKIIVALLLVVALVATFAACGKKFTCDICDEEKTGTPHEEKVFGETVVYCDECYEKIEDFEDDLKDIGDEIGDELGDLFD